MFNVVVTKILLESPSLAFIAVGNDPIFGFINLASFRIAITLSKAAFLIFQFLSPSSSMISDVILSLKRENNRYSSLVRGRVAQDQFFLTLIEILIRGI